MLEILYKKEIFVFLILFSCIKVNTQSSIKSIYENCSNGILDLNQSVNNELTEEILNSAVTKNLHNISESKILSYFSKEYQLFLFQNSFCTEKYLEEAEMSIGGLQNLLHLFSINGNFEKNNSYIKFVIQTKKQFNILYYDLKGNRIYNDINISNTTYKIITNVFHNFNNSIFHDDYLVFENKSINIFDENEQIFNDICYLYKINNISKSPALRKKLYYFKYIDAAYPLLESPDNCRITNNSVSYINESFILEYTCKHNLTIQAKQIDIFNISILSKEQKEKYEGPASLNDQEKILYCNKETYNNKSLRKNVGFYISLFLLFVVFICWISLIFQKYDISNKAPVDSPPKRSLQNDLASSTKNKKKVNFSSVEILASGRKIKKKKFKSANKDNDSEDNEDVKNKNTHRTRKKKKKKKNMIDDNNNEENSNNSYNNDLEWYSNNLVDEENKNSDEDDNNEQNQSYNNTDIKTKKKKKIKKKKKGKRKIKNFNNEDEEKAKSDDDENKGYNDGNNIYGKNINENIINNNDNINMNKTMTHLSNAYNKFKDNSANQIGDNIQLKRLIIITNLGKNLEENKLNFNTNELLRQSPFYENSDINNINNINNDINNYNNNDINNGINKDINMNANSNEGETKENYSKKNSLLPMIKDNIVDDGQIGRNKIMSKIVGFEDDSFLSNIKRDYLQYNDAIFCDNRDYYSIFTHLLRLKNDLINIFCCSYSFAPYSIRFIKFLFFFHFLFYLETVCIGQKYYFDKYFSKEYQDFIKKKNNFNLINSTNAANNNNLTFSNISINNDFFLEKYISAETIELARIHYLYTFRHAFPRVLIPMALSFISYSFTALLSPRRKILKILLNPDLKENDKIGKYKKLSQKYKNIFIIFGTFALLFMVFFFYSITNYFVIFDDAKYDIPQSFILSGLIRFIIEIIIWAIIANVRVLSVESHSSDFYRFIRGISEIN